MSISRIRYNIRAHFVNEFFTSKCLAKKMRAQHSTVSVALAQLHKRGEIKVVGYRKNPITGHFLNVYARMDKQECVWWYNSHNANFVEV